MSGRENGRGAAHQKRWEVDSGDAVANLVRCVVD